MLWLIIRAVLRLMLFRPDASAVVVVAAKDVDRVKATVAAAEKDFNLVYGETDPNAVFEVTPAALPKSVLSAEDTTSIVDVINLLHCGVFAMDRRLPRFCRLFQPASERLKLVKMYWPSSLSLFVI